MGIRLSEKHGVNPAIPVCFFCGEKKNEIILAGRMMHDVEAPKNVVWDKRPCDKCASYMEQGIILISVKDREPQGDNPYRTGGWCVVKALAMERLVGEKHPMFKARYCFIEDKAWDSLGLPRETIKERTV